MLIYGIGRIRLPPPCVKGSRQFGVYLLMNQRLLPETGFLRLSTILKLIPVGKTTWWAGVKSGQFPQSLKLGRRVTVWRVEDIKRLIESGHHSAPSLKEDQDNA